MWSEENGKKIFKGGKEAFDAAAQAAAKCPGFKEDCEEECVADEEQSCYNCRYRRWTKDSFLCMKGETP